VLPQSSQVIEFLRAQQLPVVSPTFYLAHRPDLYEPAPLLQNFQAFSMLDRGYYGRLQRDILPDAERGRPDKAFSDGRRAIRFRFTARQNHDQKKNKTLHRLWVANAAT
jgi:hypothetical protein